MRDHNKSLNRSGGWARNLKFTVAGRHLVSLVVRRPHRRYSKLFSFRRDGDDQLGQSCRLHHDTLPVHG